MSVASGAVRPSDGASQDPSVVSRANPIHCCAAGCAQPIRSKGEAMNEFRMGLLKDRAEKIRPDLTKARKILEQADTEHRDLTDEEKAFTEPVLKTARDIADNMARLEFVTSDYYWQPHTDVLEEVRPNVRIRFNDDVAIQLRMGDRPNDFARDQVDTFVSRLQELLAG